MNPSDPSSCHAKGAPIVRAAAQMIALGGLAVLGSCAEPSSSQSNISGSMVRLYQETSQSCAGSDGAMSCSLTLTARISSEQSAELKTDDDLRNHCSTIFDNYRKVTQSKTCSAGPNILSGSPGIDDITSVTCSFPVQDSADSGSGRTRTATLSVAAQSTSMSDEVAQLCSENGVTCVVESDPCKGDGLVLKITDSKDQLGGLGIAKICHAYSKPTRGNFNFEATLTSRSYPNGVTVCKGVFGSFNAGETEATAPAPQPEPQGGIQ